MAWGERGGSAVVAGGLRGGRGGGSGGVRGDGLVVAMGLRVLLQGL